MYVFLARLRELAVRVCDPASLLVRFSSVVRFLWHCVNRCHAVI